MSLGLKIIYLGILQRTLLSLSLFLLITAQQGLALYYIIFYSINSAICRPSKRTVGRPRGRDSNPGRWGALGQSRYKTPPQLHLSSISHISLCRCKDPSEHLSGSSLITCQDSQVRLFTHHLSGQSGTSVQLYKYSIIYGAMRFIVFSRMFVLLKHCKFVER